MERHPTHSEVTRFISSILPPKTNDVNLLYHVPRAGHYNFETFPVEHIVLSVTPTPNIYSAIGRRDGSTTPQASIKGSQEARPPHTLCFLHRPFTLDRYRVRKHVLVLASHKSFDENLTVGYNVPLAQRLGLDIPDSVCVQGYKNDPERKIGIVGRVNMILGPLLRSIEEQFGEIEFAQEGSSEEIYAIAIMNAFHNDEVERVLDIAQEQKWAPDSEDLGRHILYLTGQPRESGLLAAKERGMTVACVGHRVAEQWGITYLAEQLRNAFPSTQVKEIYEDGLPEGTQ